jgi:hypothetical protein
MRAKKRVNTKASAIAYPFQPKTRFDEAPQRSRSLSNPSHRRSTRAKDEPPIRTRREEIIDRLISNPATGVRNIPPAFQLPSRRSVAGAIANTANVPVFHGNAGSIGAIYIIVYATQLKRNASDPTLYGNQRSCKERASR